MTDEMHQYHHYLSSARSKNTQRAYESDMQHFRRWGGRIPATPETLARYLADCAEQWKFATLARHVISIGQAHVARSKSNPADSALVKAMLRGIRRQHGAAQRQAKPLTTAQLKKLVPPVVGDRPLRDCRDRAILLVGFAAAFRRSELVSLRVSDIDWSRRGVVLHLRASKTDAARIGRHIALPFAQGSLCPVRALKVWLTASSIQNAQEDRPLFSRIDRHGIVGTAALSGAAVGLILKIRMRVAGIDANGYSAHSLRAGLVTTAAFAGVPTWQIRRQTGHTSEQMVARYIRSSDLFNGNAARAVL